MIDLLLAPVSSEAPSGSCLEYDRRFQSLVSASRGRGEQQLGSNIVPAADPDWHFLIAEASSLLKESRDIRLLVIWTYASVRLSGLEGLARGIDAIAALIDAQWGTLHPLIEQDGDWYIRVNAVAGLADPDSVLQVLRGVVVGSIQGVAITVRDVCALFDGNRPEACPAQTFEQLRKSLHASNVDLQLMYDTCHKIAGGLASIKASFVSRLGNDAQPNLDSLGHIIEALRCLYAREPGEELAPDASDIGYVASAAASLLPAQVVQSKNDALRALALAREYFERNEPSNPASLLIQRAERLASSTFLEIIEEMAPASMDHIRIQAGLGR